MLRARSACLLAAGALAVAAGGAPRAGVPLDRLVGQRLVVAMRGTTPSDGLLRRIRAGHVGGVILFGRNVRSRAQLRALTASLQRAAREGGAPPLLVAVDQEGGPVRRLPWAPPGRSAAELGVLDPEAVRAEGRRTATALRAAGVDVDLAPVADVPSVPGSFLAAQARAFSTSPARVADIASAFALGLADGGVAATAKHFPGLGRAATSTDLAPVTVDASLTALARDLVPFRRLVAAGVPLVMVSNASYTALDAKPAAWSPAVQRLLRRDLGFAGVTMTDAIEAGAVTRGRAASSVAVLAAQAGVDLVLDVGGEATSEALYERLLAAARDGRIPAASLERSYARILALKRGLPSR